MRLWLKNIHQGSGTSLGLWNSMFFLPVFSFMEKGYLDHPLSFASAKRMANLIDGFRRRQKQHSLLCTRATVQVLRTQSSTGRLSLSKMCDFVLGLSMPKPLDVRTSNWELHPLNQVFVWLS